VQSFEDILLYT